MLVIEPGKIHSNLPVLIICDTDDAPQKVGYDESASNLMFNEETGWMAAHRATNQAVDHV